MLPAQAEAKAERQEASVKEVQEWYEQKEALLGLSRLERNHLEVPWMTEMSVRLTGRQARAAHVCGACRRGAGRVPTSRPA